MMMMVTMIMRTMIMIFVNLYLAGVDSKQGSNSYQNPSKGETLLFTILENFVKDVFTIIENFFKDVLTIIKNSFKDVFTFTKKNSNMSLLFLQFIMPCNMILSSLHFTFISFVFSLLGKPEANHSWCLKMSAL